MKFSAPGDFPYINPVDGVWVISLKCFPPVVAGMARCSECGAGMANYNQGTGFYAPICPHCGYDPTGATESLTTGDNSVDD